jgi:hypothetical protein
VSEVARLSVAIEGKDVGLDALLAGLAPKLQATDAAGQRLSATSLELAGAMSREALAAGDTAAALAALDAALGGAGAKTQVGTAASLASARAEASLAVAVGDHAGAIQILENELSQQTVRTDAVIRAEIQLTNVENQLVAQNERAAASALALAAAHEKQAVAAAQAAAEEKLTQSSMGGLESAASGAGAAMGALGIGFAALQVGKVAVDLSLASSQIDATRESFDNLAKSVGTTGDILISKLRAAADGTVSDAALIQSANSGLLLTSGKIASDLPHILEIARAAARATGDDIGFVFNSLVTGIARGSPKVIDNAKITLDASAAFDTYAQSIGKASKDLTAAEQQQATLNAVLVAGDKLIKDAGAATANNSQTFAKFGTNVENAKNSLGSFFAGGLAPLANQFNQTATAASSLIGFFSQVGTAATASNAQLNAAAAANLAYAETLKRTNDEAAATAAGEAARSASLAQSGAATQQATSLGAAMDSERQQSAAISAAAAGAELNYANSLDLVSVQARAAAQAAQQKSDADQVAAVNAQTHTVALTALATQAQQAAQALIASGGAGARAAAILASSSSQVDVLTAAYYRLQAAQIAAGNAANTASVAQTVARQRVSGTGGRGDSSDATEGAAAAKSRADDIQKALDNQIRANGSNADKIALANRNLQEQIRLHGAGSAAAINAQTALDSAVDKSEKKAKAGGAAKVSDQQKLDNTLLSRQDKFSNQTEDSETKHQQKLLDIAAQYAEKELAQEHQNEVSKINSRADFYDRVTSSDLNKSKEGKTALSKIDADYEAAFAKSQQLAQEGKAKLGADYLALKQQQAQQQLDFEEKVAAAKDKKDKAEVQRLQQIQKLRQQAQAEEEKQLLAGGDQNVNARDKALADESVSYQGSQDKIQTASDRATEHVIANAERQGKAIDQNTQRYTSQAAAIDQTGQGANPQRPAQGTSTGVGATGATNASASTPPDAKAFSDLIDSLMSKLDEVKGAIVSAESDSAKQISGAIGRIKVSLVQ